MNRKLESADNRTIVFGVHPWMQKDDESKYEALRICFNFLKSSRNEIWVSKIDDLKVVCGLQKIAIVEWLWGM